MQHLEGQQYNPHHHAHSYHPDFLVSRPWLIYVLAGPLSIVMNWLTDVLGSLQGGSAIVLGIVIGIMTAFDMVAR